MANETYSVPVIHSTKQYWLVRTQGGKYYKDYKSGGFIGINWDEITLEDIDISTEDELAALVKERYPEQKRAGRSANQLRIFSKLMKAGDAVIITSHSSNEITIGEIVDDRAYIEVIPPDRLEENPSLCPYQKRKRVQWIKSLHKWEVDLPLFKLLQHAQHTISEANNYAELIERQIHNFFVIGETAHLVLEVKKEGKIPMPDFYRMGIEIIDILEEFGKQSKIVNVDIDDIEIKVNVQSPGKITFSGKMMVISAIGFIVIAAFGGGVTIPLPNGLDPIQLNMNSAFREISDFMDRKQAREHKDMIIKKYMEHLDVQAPDELATLLKAVDETPNENSTTKEQ